jgi:hypothetical protein
MYRKNGKPSIKPNKKTEDSACYRTVCFRTLCISLMAIMSLFNVSTALADNDNTSFFSGPTPLDNFMRWVRGDELDVEVKTAEASKTDDENLINEMTSKKTKEIKSVAEEEGNAFLISDFTLHRGSNDVKQNDKQVLDLSLPKGSFEDDSEFVLKDSGGVKMIDLFSAPLNNVQSGSSKTSFGGRILMDENFQQLEEYRFNDVRDSIEGAELTLEVKTN